jgi:nucleoid DNA-binding protein
MTIPSTSGQILSQISKKTGVCVDKVREVIMQYHYGIADCLEAEIPFTMAHFGKFFFRYKKRQIHGNYDRDKEFYDDKIHRELNFEPTLGTKKRLHGWVHDIGIRNNKIDQLTKLAIKPEEIAKIRRSKVLEEQRKLGFTPDLFYDEDKLPEHDKAILSEKTIAAPTVNEIIERLGIDFDLD